MITTDITMNADWDGPLVALEGAAAENEALLELRHTLPICSRAKGLVVSPLVVPDQHCVAVQMLFSSGGSKKR